tara:strand:- start:334 stop:675 length:342 start_codon:yes stop_codon:yes gene_type:complete
MTLEAMGLGGALLFMLGYLFTINRQVGELRTEVLNLTKLIDKLSRRTHDLANLQQFTQGRQELLELKVNMLAANQAQGSTQTSEGIPVPRTLDFVAAHRASSSPPERHLQSST